MRIHGALESTFQFNELMEVNLLRHRRRVSFCNHGFLPTYGAKRALECHAVKDTALVTLALSGGSGPTATAGCAEHGLVVVSGPDQGGPAPSEGLLYRVEVAHLEGRARAVRGPLWRVPR